MAVVGSTDYSVDDHFVFRFGRQLIIDVPKPRTPASLPVFFVTRLPKDTEIFSVLAGDTRSSGAEKHEVRHRIRVLLYNKPIKLILTFPHLFVTLFYDFMTVENQSESIISSEIM